MNYKSLQKKLIVADYLIRKNSYTEAERICRDVLLSTEDTIVSKQADHDSPLPFQAADIISIQSLALRLLSESLLEQGLIQDSLQLAREAIDCALRAENKPSSTNTLNDKKAIQCSLASYDIALKYLKKKYTTTKKHSSNSDGKNKKESETSVYVLLGFYDVILDYYTKAEVNNQEPAEKSILARISGYIGSIYFILGDYDTALKYYGEALSAYQELGDTSFIASLMENIGSVYDALGA